MTRSREKGVAPCLCAFLGFVTLLYDFIGIIQQFLEILVILGGILGPFLCQILGRSWEMVTNFSPIKIRGF
jgi:hypothetical protein